MQRIYSQLCDEKRNQERPRLRFKDVVKRNIRHRQINLKSWQTMAGNRAAWSFVIKRNHEVVLVVSTDCKRERSVTLGNLNLI